MKKREGRLLATVLSVMVLLCKVYIPAGAVVNEIAGHWGQTAIQYCVDHQYMVGIRENSFQPDGSVTRAHVVQVLFNMAGKPYASERSDPFTDTCGHWAIDAIFVPDTTVTRGQVTTMFMRYTAQLAQFMLNYFKPLPQPQSPTPVSVQELSAERISNREILLSWPDTDDELVSTYVVYRKDILDGASDWGMVASIPSDGALSGNCNSYTDKLASAEFQQLAYRVDVEPVESAYCTAETGRVLLASNLLICLDPGHYIRPPKYTGEDSYGYTEEYCTLQIGLKLKQILKEKYGINSYLTREAENITLNGYTNSDLDEYHLALRGEYAKGSDFFFSLHTNANDDDANGYPTWNQPISINKPLVIINQTAVGSEQALKIANAVGERVSEVNYQQGLTTVASFSPVYEGSGVIEWTSQFNDSLNIPGTVCQRKRMDSDYYGVLRGAADVGVPGAIIEHGMHTVAGVRQSAMQGDLIDLWAAADASGIASGFGFVEINNVVIPSVQPDRGTN